MIVQLLIYLMSCAALLVFWDYQIREFIVGKRTEFKRWTTAITHFEGFQSKYSSDKGWSNVYFLVKDPLKREEALYLERMFLYWLDRVEQAERKLSVYRNRLAINMMTSLGINLAVLFGILNF